MGLILQRTWLISWDHSFIVVPKKKKTKTRPNTKFNVGTLVYYSRGKKQAERGKKQKIKKNEINETCGSTYGRALN